MTHRKSCGSSRPGSYAWAWHEKLAVIAKLLIPSIYAIGCLKHGSSCNPSRSEYQIARLKGRTVRQIATRHEWQGPRSLSVGVPPGRSRLWLDSLMNLLLTGVWNSAAGSRKTMGSRSNHEPDTTLAVEYPA